MTGATTTTRGAAGLAARIEQLEAALRAAVPGPADPPAAAGERAGLLRLVAGYVRPRLGRAGPPLVTVLFGVSGTGKSTLLNSLAGDAIGRPSPLRPGTRRAVVWSHPDHPWAQHLPSADRIESRHPLLEPFSLVDTPPPGVPGDDDPVADWLACADLGVHVASAARYADAAGWALIEAAAGRGLPVLYVLNRLPAGADAEGIVADYAARLAAEGHLPSSDESQIVAVPEGDPAAGHGALPEAAVAALTTRLSGIEPAAAGELALDATLAAVCGRVAALAGRLAAGAAAASELVAAAREPYRTAGDRLAAQVTGSGLGLVAGGGWDEQRDAVTRLVGHVAGNAAQHAAAAWDTTDVGRRLLAERPSLWRHGPDIETQTADRLEDWLDVLAATARVRFTRWWAVRRRRALVEALQRAALTGSGDDGDLTRAGAETAMRKGVRADLAAMLRAALEADGARFAVAAGDPAAAAGRAEELAAAGRAVAEAMRR